jgi:hypothetical protein
MRFGKNSTQVRTKYQVDTWLPSQRSEVREQKSDFPFAISHFSFVIDGAGRVAVDQWLMTNGESESLTSDL